MSNLLSIIIAVIGISLVLFGLFKLYGITVSSEGENARNTLDRVIGNVQNLEEGQESEITIQGFDGADSWYFVGFSLNETDIKPDKCFRQSCLCLCDASDLSRVRDNRITPSRSVYTKEQFGGESGACQNAGFCRELNEEDVMVATNHLLRTSRTGSFSEQSGVDIEGLIDYPYINLNRALMNVKVILGDENVSISHEGENITREEIIMEGGGP